MLIIKLIAKKINILELFVLLALISGCTSPTNQRIDVSEKKINIRLDRFEQELFSADTIDSLFVKQTRIKYGSFFDLYCTRMIQLPAVNDGVLALNMSQYTKDKYIREVYLESQKKYKDLRSIKSNLEDAFKHYSYYFPKKTIPNAITYIAPFNYNVMTMDSTIGIGLDMYLGTQFKYYSSLELPQYMIKKFREEYIVSDCMKGWFQSEWELNEQANDMLSNMIYQGKLLYFLELTTPDINDTIRLGYTANQLQWCDDNEAKVWSFLIEQKLLFNKTPGIFMKFINDGNSTNGFPKEAPAKLGCYIGWRIIQSYMQENGNITLEQLLLNNDAQNILNNSKYKPKK